MRDGHVVKAPFIVDISADNYLRSSYIFTVDLLACDADVAPEYQNSASMDTFCRRLRIVVSKICTLSTDVKKLPNHAWARKYGGLGAYYSADIELAMRFGSMLEFELMWNGEVKGTVSANYV